MSTPLAYWIAVALGAAIAVALCVGCRRRPGPWTTWAGRAIAIVLALDAVVFLVRPLVQGGWSVQTSLPLALCDLALVVAAVTCWWPGWQLGVELTYFWGLAGTLQAVITPDLSAGFPQVEFFQFVAGHLGIVIAALYLVVGLRLEPRPGAVPRVFGLTVAYAVLLGIFDWATGSNYMYLAAPPDRATLLSALGPWPWYLLTASAVAYLLLVLLDLPFRRSRRRSPPSAVVGDGDPAVAQRTRVAGGQVEPGRQLE
ncbi:hypothetical protein GCM10027053_16570 [Intrasporangium mesophilum]